MYSLEAPLRGNEYLQRVFFYGGIKNKISFKKMTHIPASIGTMVAGLYISNSGLLARTGSGPPAGYQSNTKILWVDGGPILFAAKCPQGN